MCPASETGLHFLARGRRPTKPTLFPYTTLFRSRGRLDHPGGRRVRRRPPRGVQARSEEHTSELQSRLHLVCRLLLEKKNWLAHTGALYVAEKEKRPRAHELHWSEWAAARTWIPG